MELSLSQLKGGQKGRIKRVTATGELRRRLFDMGCTTGATIEFIKKAPLGDPIEINIRGYRLSLRRAEADSILVECTEEN